MPSFRFPPKLGGIAGATSTADGAVMTSAQTLSVAQIKQVRANLNEWTQYIAADLVKSADTTLTTVFTQSLAAGAYRVRGVYMFNISGGTPGAKFELSFSGTTTTALATAKHYNTNLLVSGGLTSFNDTWLGAAQSRLFGANVGAPTGGYVHQSEIEGFIVVSVAGTFAVKLAQNSASNSTTFYGGGNFTVTGMAP